MGVVARRRFGQVAVVRLLLPFLLAATVGARVIVAAYFGAACFWLIGLLQRIVRHDLWAVRMKVGPLFPLPLPRAGKLLQGFARGERANRADMLAGIERRRGAPVVDAPHLARKLLHICRRVAGNEQRRIVAMPGKRDVARRRTPVFRMIEIGLIERAPLPAVDRAGIAVTEFVERLGIEGE